MTSTSALSPAPTGSTTAPGGGPPVTPAEEATILAQLTACRDQNQLTLQQYEQALHQLRELNLKGEPSGPSRGGVNPPP